MTKTGKFARLRHITLNTGHFYYTNLGELELQVLKYMLIMEIPMSRNEIAEDLNLNKGRNNHVFLSLTRKHLIEQRSEVLQGYGLDSWLLTNRGKAVGTDALEMMGV